MAKDKLQFQIAKHETNVLSLLEIYEKESNTQGYVNRQVVRVLDTFYKIAQMVGTTDPTDVLVEVSKLVAIKEERTFIVPSANNEIVATNEIPNDTGDKTSKLSKDVGKNIAKKFDLDF